MIVELSFGLDAKIPNLTPKRIHMPCECKVLKCYQGKEEPDILVDLCDLHTEEYKKMESGLVVSSGTLIPGLEIERE